MAQELKELCQLLFPESANGPYTYVGPLNCIFLYVKPLNPLTQVPITNL